MSGKNKQIVYNIDEDLQVQFVLELFRHNFKPRMFFENVIKGVIKHDEDLLKFFNKIKIKEKIQSKSQIKEINKEQEKEKEIEEIFAIEELNEEEIEEIFKILERELEFG